MILLIDNYDSFVFNLERYLQRLGQTTVVVRNDEVDMARIAAGEFSAVVISPGPKAPEQAGQSLEVIKRFYARVPMLGVCLGHQAICQAFGAAIIRAPRAVHGQSSPITHQASPLFAGLPNPFQAARYHSLIAAYDSLPSDLRVIATTSSPGDQLPIVMAVEHTRERLFGVQFHPESILSDMGYRILANFLQIAGLDVGQQLPKADFASTQVWNNFQSKNSVANQVEAQDKTTNQWPPTVLPLNDRRPDD